MENDADKTCNYRMTKPENKEIIIYLLIRVTRVVLSLVHANLSGMNFPTLKDLHREKENLQPVIILYQL